MVSRSTSQSRLFTLLFKQVFFVRASLYTRSVTCHCHCRSLTEPRLKALKCHKVASTHQTTTPSQPYHYRASVTTTHQTISYQFQYVEQKRQVPRNVSYLARQHYPRFSRLALKFTNPSVSLLSTPVYRPELGRIPQIRLLQHPRRRKPRSP